MFNNLKDKIEQEINNITKPKKLINDDELKGKVNGYLQGYYEYKINKNDKEPMEEGFIQYDTPTYSVNKSKQEVINSQDMNVLEPKNSMQTEQENMFKYGLDNNLNNENILFDFEDPTYLGFELLFETDTSPLFSYGIDNIENSDSEQKYYAQNSVLSFIDKYSNIDEISKRKEIYSEFIRILNGIFDRTEYNFNNRNYVVESITGLDKLNNKFIKYKEDKITVTLTEDVSLKMYYLSELYRNLVYSYKNQRYLIPENLLRFDLMIKVSDIRSFKIIKEKNNKIYETNSEPSYIIFKLHDCIFNFSNSNSFGADLSMGGYNKAINNTPATLTFDIYYKSISKEFNSPLIYKSFHINNKKTEIINESILKYNELFSKLNNENVSIDNVAYNDKHLRQPSTIINPDFTEVYTEKIKQRFNSVRGGLINTIHGARKITVLEEIFPQNIYNKDFGKFSLRIFAEGLAGKISNNIQNKI